MSDYFENYFDKVNETASWLKNETNIRPSLVVVLTGGVDGPLNELAEKKEILAKDIPNFPSARAEGHEGKMYFGKLDGKDILLLKGRYHYYEGHTPQQVVFPYFVFRELGVKNMITTNAVGGIRNDLDAGDIMLINDQINCMGCSPLRGIAIQRKENQFTDMTNAYDKQLQQKAKQCAKQMNLDLKEGVYLGTSGPNYETPSEIRMFRNLGADAVGMSTVFEIIACNFLGINVLAFSCIANPSADRHEGEMSHEKVLKAMNASAPKLSELVSICAKEI